MKCKDCKACKKGWFSSDPDDYVCIGVKEPFVINDINKECTEYEDKHDITGIEYVCKNFTKEEIVEKIIFYAPDSPCIEGFGIITEDSRVCNIPFPVYQKDCEECWNSKVVGKI